MRDWRRADGGARHAPDKPMKPQVVAARAGQAAAGRRHRLLRLRHDHHLVRRATCRVRARPDALAVSGTLATHGLRPALRHRRRSSPIPGRQVVAVRRRRRLLDADGRARHGGASTSCRSRSSSSRTTRSARSSGSRWCSWATPSTAASCSRSTSPRRPRPWAGGASPSASREDRGRARRGARHRGPVVIEAVVDPYEPPMPPKMPPDYADNFRQALPETPGREAIEASVGKSRRRR